MWGGGRARVCGTGDALLLSLLSSLASSVYVSGSPSFVRSFVRIFSVEICAVLVPWPIVSRSKATKGILKPASLLEHAISQVQVLLA